MSIETSSFLHIHSVPIGPALLFWILMHVLNKHLYSPDWGPGFVLSALQILTHLDMTRVPLLPLLSI